METRLQEFGRCRALLAKQLSPSTVTYLATYFNLTPYSTVTPVTPLMVVNSLYEMNQIGPESIDGLLRALHDLGFLREELDAKRVFDEYLQQSSYNCQDEEMFTDGNTKLSDEDTEKGEVQEKEMPIGNDDDDVDTNAADDKGLETDWCMVRAMTIPCGEVYDDVNVSDGEVAHCAAICVILETSHVDSEWAECVGQPMGLYLHDHTYKFEKDGLYRLRQFQMTRRDHGLELLVFRRSRISEVAPTLLKNKNYEQYSIENTSKSFFPSKIHLPTSVTVKEACQTSQRCTIFSIRGIVFEINNKIGRKTFQISDDGQTSLTVVVPYDKNSGEGIKEKDIIEFRFLEAISDGQKLKYLLFGNRSEIIHLKESDQRLVSLLDCELVKKASRLEGTVVECEEPQYYQACSHCFQKKLISLRGEIYKCFKCKRAYNKEETDTCFTVCLRVQGTSEVDIWEGVMFKSTIKEILAAGYQDYPTKQHVNALSSLLVNRKVQFTRKKFDPPLSDVFKNFTFL